MATWFRPPTYDLPFTAAGRDRLWSRVKYLAGRTVFEVDPDTGGITAFPGRQTVLQNQVAAAEAAGQKVWTGGGVHEVTAGQATALTSAGYGAFLSATPP